MDAEMASWKSTDTYVDEDPPPGANIVSGMWIFRVKRPPGSPPVLKARYVARGFRAALAHLPADQPRRAASFSSSSQRGQLRLAYVASEANTADIFTKALAPGDHQRFCTLLDCVVFLFVPNILLVHSFLFLHTGANFIESERHYGIAELLEIQHSFVLPLKEEYKQILDRVLVPVHKPKCVSMYHQQLSYCITQFVEKDPKLADSVLRELLKLWPSTNSQNELLILAELEKILELTQAPEFEMVMTPLFQQIARCLSSSNFE
ncbi:unnamed protein product, partial [Closterium sp. NIES-54]